MLFLVSAIDTRLFEIIEKKLKKFQLKFKNNVVVVPLRREISLASKCIQPRNRHPYIANQQNVN